MERAKNNSLGKRHHRAKLTPHEVELIRTAHESGMTVKELSAKFEIGKSAISKIVNYGTWR